MILRQEKETLQELIRKVKLNAAVLVDKVDRAHNEVNQKLVKQRDDLKFYLDKLHGPLDFAKNIIATASNDEFYCLAQKFRLALTISRRNAQR